MQQERCDRCRTKLAWEKKAGRPSKLCPSCRRERDEAWRKRNKKSNEG